VLGDTVTGLTGSEISTFLRQVDIDDVTVSMTKRHGLYQALNCRQTKDRCGNQVVAFLRTVMKPVSYLDKVHVFNERRDRLNEVLSFAGFFLKEDGSLRSIEPARTIPEAQQTANRLHAELTRRNVHLDILRFCRTEFLQENFFHAVFEATKSIADKIRQKTNLISDGASLVDDALGLGKRGLPLLAFNSLQTETEHSEHKGLMHLMKGVFGAFRNVTAHEPKIKWPITEQDALDLLTIASLLHRRLDTSIAIEFKETSSQT
jgi:uncharacterized protein (TIGR02391 family)